MHWKCPRCAWVNDTQKAFETKTCFKCGYHDGHQPHIIDDDYTAPSSDDASGLVGSVVEAIIDSSLGGSDSTPSEPDYSGGGGDFSGGGSTGDF